MVDACGVRRRPKSRPEIAPLALYSSDPSEHLRRLQAMLWQPHLKPQISPCQNDVLQRNRQLQYSPPRRGHCDLILHTTHMAETKTPGHPLALFLDGLTFVRSP